MILDLDALEKLADGPTSGGWRQLIQELREARKLSLGAGGQWVDACAERNDEHARAEAAESALEAANAEATRLKTEISDQQDTYLYELEKAQAEAAAMRVVVERLIESVGPFPSIGGEETIGGEESQAHACARHTLATLDAGKTILDELTALRAKVAEYEADRSASAEMQYSIGSAPKPCPCGSCVDRRAALAGANGGK